jgi:hypothetical protein
MVSPPAAKATTVTMSVSSPASDEAHGIEVEGLDASTWTLAPESGSAHKSEATATVEPDHRPDASAFVAAGAPVEGGREYKLLTPKDKYFDGKFELARLEEALNHFAKQGWVVKAVSTPHVKNFSGVLEETVVVLLER